MLFHSSRFLRFGLLPAALALAVVSVGAQGRGPAPAALGVPTQVRIALGHGDLTEARRLAQASTDESVRGLGLALVDLFEGKDADARTKLTPIADRSPLGDAALELGLLDMRTGHIAEGRRRLDRLTAVRT